MLLRTEFDVLENGEETYEPHLRVEEDGIEGPVEYRRPVWVEGIMTIYWLEVLLGFCGGRWEWGVENVGKVEAYIYIRASCLQWGFPARGIPRGHHEACILRVGGDWASISSSWRKACHFYSWWRSWYSSKISAEPVKLDFGSHEASVIGYPAHLTKNS